MLAMLGWISCIIEKEQDKIEKINVDNAFLKQTNASFIPIVMFININKTLMKVIT